MKLINKKIFEIHRTFTKVFSKERFSWLFKVKACLKSFWDEVNHYDIFKYASAMAYTTLLAIVPAIAFICSLIAVFTPFWSSKVDVVGIVKGFILSNLAVGAGDALINYIDGFIQNINVATIGLTGLVGILVSLVLLLRQIELALNRIWSVKETRNTVTRFVYFWTFITLGSFLLGLVLGLVSEFNLLNFIPFMKTSENIDTSMVIPNIALVVFFYLLYKIVPNCYVRTVPALIGTLFSVTLFDLAGYIYRIYTLMFNGYNKIYGAVSVVLFFLIWLYIVWIIILLGALLSRKVQLYGEKLKREYDNQSSNS